MPHATFRRRTLLLALMGLPLAATGALLLASSCQVEPAANDADRQQVLRDLVANVMVPTYADLATATAALKAATSSLRQAPTADTLAAAQRAYRDARSLYKSSEALHYGPADDLLITGGAIDNWPADGAAIEALVAGASPLGVADVASLGANQRGFPALEQLLFDNVAGELEVLARFQRPVIGPRRAELAESSASDLADKCRAVHEGWIAPGGYAEELAEAGVSSRTFRTQSEGVDKVVTGLLYLAELMVMRKLAKPLGIDVDGTAQPELEEGPRSGSSLTDLRDNLLGIKALYTGQRNERVGKGLAEPVRAMNPGAAMRFEQALEAALAAVAAVPPPFGSALVTQRALVEAAYQAVRQVKLSIQMELAGALGASIGFGYSDTD